MDKAILQHTKECQSTWAKDRHDYINDTLQPKFNEIGKKFEKIEDKLDKNDRKTEKSELLIDGLTKATDTMNKNIEKIEKKLEQTIKEGFSEIKDNFVTKAEYTQTTNKVDRIGKAMWFIITGFGSGLIVAIYNVILK